jgi:hypothetical protein
VGLTLLHISMASMQMNGLIQANISLIPAMRLGRKGEACFSPSLNHLHLHYIHYIHWCPCNS